MGYLGFRFRVAGLGFRVWAFGSGLGAIMCQTRSKGSLYPGLAGIVVVRAIYLKTTSIVPKALGPRP